MDGRSRDAQPIMGTAIKFDLNSALRSWREALSRSPHFRDENLDELESHLRDSVSLLESKGLSPDEAFLVGTRRVGSPAAIEPEFAKENGSRDWPDIGRSLMNTYLNKIIHGLILCYFTLGCWFIWGMVQLGRMVGAGRGEGHLLPFFTRWWLSAVDLWYVPPLLAAMYCVLVWLRPPAARHSWFGFFAIMTALLVLLLVPAVVAASLPMIDTLNHMPRGATIGGGN